MDFLMVRISPLQLIKPTRLQMQLAPSRTCFITARWPIIPVCTVLQIRRHDPFWIARGVATKKQVTSLRLSGPLPQWLAVPRRTARTMHTFSTRKPTRFSTGQPRIECFIPFATIKRQVTWAVNMAPTLASHSGMQRFGRTHPRGR